MPLAEAAFEKKQTIFLWEEEEKIEGIDGF